MELHVWTINKSGRNRTDAFEMWFYKKYLNTQGQHNTNESILNEFKNWKKTNG